MRRAVITGLGPVTPIGIGTEAFWAGLQAGESAVRHIRAFDPSPFRCHVAAEVAGFDPTGYLDARQLRHTDRFAQFAVAAARLAIRDSGLDLGAEAPERVVICIGSALGGTACAEAQHAAYIAGGVRAVAPSLALSVFCGSAACNIAIALGITGPVTSNSNSCASGAVALGEALGLIRAGVVDVVLAGGAEAPLAPLSFGAFALIRAMSCRNEEPERACRPFDAERDGFVMAEGAAVLVVEEMARARARGAPIYAEVAGYGLTNDAFHMAAPRPDGACAARAMALALADAGMAPADVDYVNAHGSSTPLNDRAETLAIKCALGERAYRIPVSSTKGHHAHALGATGAFEAAACALALARGFVPPTLNLENPDPECDLDCTPRVGRHMPLRAVLSNSFGFGGINACLALRQAGP